MEGRHRKKKEERPPDKIRVMYDCPERKTRVSEFFDDTIDAQKLVGELQKKGITPRISRVSQ